MEKAFSDIQKKEDSPSYSVFGQQNESQYFAYLYRHFGDKIPVVKEMLGIFKFQIPLSIDELEKCLKNENYKGFYFEIHRIKSTISIIGLPVLLELAMIMERDSYEDSDVSMISDYFKKFKKQVVEDLIIVENELERLNQLPN